MIGMTVRGLMIVAALAIATLPPAMADDILYRVRCPAFWPGSGKDALKLTYSRAHYRVGIPFGPDDTDVQEMSQHSILLDCAYGALPLKGAAWDYNTESSPWRLTITIPGRARKCGFGDITPYRDMWCDTAREADGTIGPIQMHIAEIPSLSTTLLGFGLRQSMDAIRATAAASGFSCADDGTNAEALHCRHNADSVDVEFLNGRSRAVHRFLTRDSNEQAGNLDRTFLRFGLNYKHNGSDYETDIWQLFFSPVRVVFRTDSDPMVLTIEDMGNEVKKPKNP